MIDNHNTASPTRNLLLIGVGIATTLYLALSLILIFQQSPFGWDEAVYALRARHLVESMEPAFYWHAFRAPGLPFVLQLAWLASATEIYLRLIPAMFGIPLLLSTMYIGNRMFGARAAIVATIGVALTPVILLASTQVWPDVPGAAIGLCTVALYLYALDRPVASKWMLGVPLLTFVATMLRFGAPIPIAVALMGITIWRWRIALASRLLVFSTALLVGLTAYLVLFVPAVTGWAQFGDPVAPITANAALATANGFPWYGAFIDYVRIGYMYFGGTASLALAIGLVGAVAYALRKTARSLEVWVTLGIGFATFILLSLALKFGEARYLSPVIPWIWIPAGHGLIKVVSIPKRTLSIVIAVPLVLFVSVDSYSHARRQNTSNTLYASGLKAAGSQINAETIDNECGVTAENPSQVGWYSHCPTKADNPGELPTDSEFFGDGPRFLIIVQDARLQIQEGTLKRFDAVQPDPVGVAVGGFPSRKWKYYEILLVEDPDS